MLEKNRDIIGEISKHLDKKMLLTGRLVNKAWYSVCTEKFAKSFGDSSFTDALMLNLSKLRKLQQSPQDEEIAQLIVTIEDNVSTQIKLLLGELTTIDGSLRFNYYRLDNESLEAIKNKATKILEEIARTTFYLYEYNLQATLHISPKLSNVTCIWDWGNLRLKDDLKLKQDVFFFQFWKFENVMFYVGGLADKIYVDEDQVKNLKKGDREVDLLGTYKNVGLWKRKYDSSGYEGYKKAKLSEEDLPTSDSNPFIGKFAD